MEITSVLHRKLQSKTEALRILRRELEIFRTERDQFKLMAETLQLRYSSLKRSSELTPTGEADKSNVASLLHDTRERNTKLTTEVETLKQKLNELQGDIELLRSKMHNFKVNNNMECKEELEWKQNRTLFIRHLENLKQKNAQLTFDFKTVIDEKEELITERDAYKCKAHRLNHELITALKANGSHPKFLDIDSILLENKYLHERVKNFENELDITKQSMNKYKAMLETKRKKGVIKLGTNTNAENILSQKQVEAILEAGTDLTTRTESIEDLKSLCFALMDNLNDKNLALSHQKKTNKVLATKIAELEQRIQTIASHNDESDGVSLNNVYAPSQLLLQGYSPSSVDVNEITTATEPSKITLSTTDSGTSDAEQSKKVISGRLSDDGMSSLSTESSRSVVSSEYGSVGAVCSFSKSSSNALYAYMMPSIAILPGNRAVLQSNNIVTETIARQRMEDLQDLPPELAELVQNALHELDLRDYEKASNH